MVLLNAERRTWGIWLASGGLFMGAAFFVSHTAILGYGLHHVGGGTDFWWQVGWVPVITLPFVWYTVMLWYSGYWEHRQGDLQRRQRPWFFLAGLLAIALVGLFTIANPLPSYSQVAQLNLAATPALAGIPIVILVYPLYITLCIVLSLDALRRPEPSARVMGDLARRRARPWLVAASVVLLIVSLLVAWVMMWIVSNARHYAVYEVYASMSLAVAWFDLIIASLIALSIVLLGQATVAYEVFAGKTLPRRGLMHHWRLAVILAAGYGLAVGWILTLQLQPLYGLLLTTLLMTLFYALLGWRSFEERERYMEHLRPFVASPRLYERLLAPSPSAELDLDVRALFQTLCGEVLGTRLAYLVPLGPLTPLVGSALTYPEDDGALPTALTGATVHFGASQAMCAPLDPAQYSGATWAVPLRSQQGLIGVLLMGEKQDGGLYTQEEIEIAQASGERLMDTLASIEVARRLLALQRQRLAESRDYGELSRAVFDQRARRLLHDEVLPLLHTAMLTLNSTQGKRATPSDDLSDLLADAHRQISHLLREMPSAITPGIERLGLAGALGEVVDAELADAFDEVTWQIDDVAESKARAMSSLAAEVLFYAAREAMRNAARHGRDEANAHPLHLRLCLVWHERPEGSGPGRLEVLIEDDGVGLQAHDPLVDTGGQGLALHSAMMAVVGGTLAVESLPGTHTRVRLTLPTN
jgi:signal transduction histidine kinase